MSKETTALAQPETQSYRLPRTVVPSRYEIKLSPELSSFRFQGEEIISLTVKEPVTEMLLNALELEVEQAYLTGDGGTRYEGKISMDAESERMELSFGRTVTPGSWTLHIKFSGTLNDKLHGFYRSTYKDAAGKSKILATTQFEATDARRAFPCWDEPDFKAVYKITLVIDENLTAISNAGIESEKKLPAQKKKELVFKDTIKMSTYLVAFVIGELEGSQQTIVDGKPVRVYSGPGKKHLTKFAEGIAAHSLSFFARYYGVPYPGDKLDLIAIPDFAFGAMENLGCITFRESALLVDEKTASHAELERIADVVAHEIAHMWFGDLTTMSWWNGIWLNEAFATFAEMMAVNAWKPEWKRWDTFGASRAAAFTVDGLKSTRAIEFPVRHPEECQGMFDVLTYEKGASVLRMLEQYIGEPVFQKGISFYLNKHQFANTETSDLWAALEQASGQPVMQLMDSWIFQQGYPMISASLDHSESKLELSQQRFFYLTDSAAGDHLFHVPIMLRAGCGKNILHKKVLLTEKTTTIDLGEKVDWLVINDGGHGFYRVHYSSELLARLTANLFETLTPIERFNLANDTWAMVLAGHITLSEYLKMSLLFREETDKNVWSTIIGSLSYLDRIVDENARGAFEAFVCHMVEPAQLRLGWEVRENEDELTGQLRGSLIGALGCQGNHRPTQEKARDMYARYRVDHTSVEPNIVPAVVSVLAGCGDRERYEEFFNEFTDAKTPQDEERYLFALAAFKNKKLLAQTLGYTLSDQVRTQNAPYLLRSVMMNNLGGHMAWEFVKAHWGEVTTKYPDNSIPRMLEGITALSRPEWEKDVNEFFQSHPVKQGAKALEQHLERLNVAVRFRAREAAPMGASFTMP